VSELPRKLGVFDAAALLVGGVIGSGIFVVPSLIAQRAPQPGLAIGLWIFAGLLVLCGALSFAELGTMLPESGGPYVYVRAAYGPFWAFLYGWTMMLVIFPASLAALVTALLLYLGQFVPMAPWAAKALGIVLLLGLSFVNARGVKLGAGVQNAFTALKVAGLVGLVGIALVTGKGEASHFSPALPDHWSLGLFASCGVAMISILFAYDGWHFVGFVAGEIRDPGRNISRAIVIGVFVVVAVYVSANLAYIFVLGEPAIARSARVGTDTMSAMMGVAGGRLMTVAILCSIFGAISANVLAGPRIFFAMARDGLLFPALATVHPTYQTPANAIWALGIWSAVLSLTGGFEHLITLSQFPNWIFFTMVVWSVIVLRRAHPEWPRPYRVAAYPLTVVIFVIVSSVFVINTLIESPTSALLGLLLLLAGVPFYFAKGARRRQPAGPAGS
jgi:APA family basic amino acid/polyamine antiporter